MKKSILLGVITIFLLVITVFVYYSNVNLFASNNEFYNYFEDEELIGVDGEISLLGISSLRDNLYNEVLVLFSSDLYDYDKYLKLMDDNKNSNLELQKEINNLSAKINDLELKKKNFSSQYNVLVNKYNSLNKKNNSSVVSVNKNNKYDFPLINQYPTYQTGCESVALTMLLRYYGVNVTPDMIIARLKKGSLPYYIDGVRYGGNPEVEFIGNPYSKSSYGVYEKPMADVANIFKSGVNAKSNFSFSEVISMVQNGKPVMVWTSMGLSLPYISSNWIYKPTGETIYWKANEHAVVMIDATDSVVVIADPMGGKIKTYSRSTFENRYNYYGKKALYY